MSREVEIESPTLAAVENIHNDKIAFIPQSERKHEQQEDDTKKAKGEKPQAAEHIKTDENSQKEKENSRIKEESSEIKAERSEIKEDNSLVKEEKTEIKEETSKIKDEKSDRKDSPLNERAGEDSEAKLGVKEDVAENRHNKENQLNPLSQD